MRKISVCFSAPPPLSACTPSLWWLWRRHCSTPWTRGGVFEDILGLRDIFGLEDVLKDTFWSFWPWSRRLSPWPWPQSLKPSKIALSSARGQHYFLTSLKVCGVPKNFFGKRFSLEIDWKFFLKAFFFGEHLRFCPWSRAFLSSASRGSVLGRAVLGLGFFCVLGLGLERCVLDSTYAMHYRSTFAQLKIFSRKNLFWCAHFSF